MKAVILAGGLGTRLSEETSLKPKPMVEIGGKPILWHIMKIYSAHDINDFIICCGYKGYVIKEYFLNYLYHRSDLSIDFEENNIDVHRKGAEPWRVTLIDTGNDTMTGGRLKRVEPYLQKNESFCLTYGDGVANIDISSLIRFHRNHGKLATLTSSYAPGRFGALDLIGDKVAAFKEKPRGDGSLINAGFFVLEPKVIERIKDDSTVWEQEPLKGLARDSELMTFKHLDFWQPMDTLRDKNYLENLWNQGNAPWKIWK